MNGHDWAPKLLDALTLARAKTAEDVKGIVANAVVPAGKAVRLRTTLGTYVAIHPSSLPTQLATAGTTRRYVGIPVLDALPEDAHLLPSGGD